MQKPVQARTRILDAAEQLFADHGFDATPTSKIAKLAAVPKGLLFYYFPTKADMLRTLVAERLALGPIDVLSLVVRGEPVRSLLNLTRRLYEIQATSEVLRVILWREQHTHPEVHANLIEHRSQLQAVIERVLHESVVGLAAARVRAAAQAWVAILTIRPLAAPGTEVDAQNPPAELGALADLICAGLTSPAHESAAPPERAPSASAPVVTDQR